MCGIAGVIKKNNSKEFSVAKINEILKLMSIRGIDFQKYTPIKVNQNLKIDLFHSRLAIIDPKNNSNQPYEDENGILSFNGEIYNYMELKKLLQQKNFKFKTNSDTEVLCKMLHYYGEKAFEKLDGMWSFFYFSKRKKTILISRDRFGEKPLYYYKSKKDFFFGSNINYILNLINDKLNINYEKLSNYLYYGFRHIDLDNKSFLKNVFELEKSHYLKIDKNLNITKKKYWNFEKIKINNKLKYADSVEYLQEILFRTVETRLRSDFKIASLLSGGVDSCSLAMVASKKFKKNIKLYTIRSNDINYNETNRVDLVVKKSSLDHKYIDLERTDKTNYLEKLIEDSKSPINSITFYLYALINKHINADKCRVLFTGVGADEMFGGYFVHYLYFLKSISKQKDFGKQLRDWKTNILKHLNNPSLKNIEMILNKKTINLNEIIGNHKIKKYFKKDHFLTQKVANFNKDYFKNILSKDLFVHMTPPQLRDSDQISMYNSIENRSPFLSKEIYEFCFSQPNNFLINNGYNKKILRDAMKPFVPSRILNDTNKIGFNANSKNVFDFKSKKVKDLMFSNSYLNSLINISEIEKLIKSNKTSNNESHLLFSILNSAIFLNQNN
jgi:asparagine synthase (glutamine-hydrolysing)